MDNNLGNVVSVTDLVSNGFSFPGDLTEFNGQLYFAASDEQNGREIYVTDGTSEGTQIVTDIMSDSSYSSPRDFTELNDLLYFIAGEPEIGNEVWVTDGTTEGTRVVTDISPNTTTDDPFYIDPFPTNLAAANDKLYFLFINELFDAELYVTDGTAEGTTNLTTNINPTGFSFSGDNNLAEANGKVYFEAGGELYVTDGTAEGTKNINPTGFFGPDNFTEFNGKLYFSARDESFDTELYVTDGTAEGTQLVADINLGSDSSNPRDLTEFNGKLYFGANDGPSRSSSRKLYVTDGTTEGTQVVADINPGGSSSFDLSYYRTEGFTEFDGKLYFRADDRQNGSELYVTDGTTEGTQLVADINPGSGSSDLTELTPFNGKLYFVADDGTSGRELYVTDGTTEGTQLVEDLNPGSSSSDPSELTVINNELFFTAVVGGGRTELFKLTFDGTVTQPSNPPIPVVDTANGSNNSGSVVSVSDIASDSFSSPDYLTEFNGQLYFTADDGQNGQKLYATDGTNEGTQIVTDVNPISFPVGDANRTIFTEFNGKLYFAGNAPVFPEFAPNFDAASERIGTELYVTDGTTEGTQLVKDINPGITTTRSDYSVNSSRPNYFTEFNGRLYFAANDSSNGRELYVTDGTESGTQLVKDIFPGRRDNVFNDNYSRVNSSSPDEFAVFNDKLYFTAADEQNGRELYVTDGTAEGTQLVADIFPGRTEYVYISYGITDIANGSNPSELTQLDDKLYFAADDGQNGTELYVTDGTAEGTQLVKDINPGSASFLNDAFSSTGFTEFNGKLYFAADDGSNGTELYVTDGTESGTNLVADINPGSASSLNDVFSLTGFTEFNGKLYFIADDGQNGSELYVTDGTESGTNLFADINPGSNGSSPSELTLFDGKLYFAANDGQNGTELYVTDGTVEGTSLVADINPGSGSSNPSNLTVVGNELFFTAIDGGIDTELFKLTFDESDNGSDGTITRSLNPIDRTANEDNLGNSDNEFLGSQGDDGITGESGNDVLSGLAGNDALDGGAGNDTLNGGAGRDTAVYQFAPAAVTVTLGEGDSLGTASDGYGDTDFLSGIENVIASEGDDSLTGNSGNNSLTGRGGNDTIVGLSGDDFLTGGMGADNLTGGAGSDRFIYLNVSQGGDTISDFVVGTDKIAAVAAGFGGGLSTGELPEGSFVYGSFPTSSDQRFIFDDTSGELFFDADGSGTAPQQLIATVGGESELSAADILIL